MQVNFYATFRQLAGARQAEINPPPGARFTACEALQAVVAAFPQLRAHWLAPNGELYPHVHGFLNGEEIPTLPHGWDTPLDESDVLDFLPPVAGGSPAGCHQEAL